MSFTHYIDGVAVNEPGGWEDFEQEISRDFDTRTISVSFPTDATFTGEGYKRLRALFVDNDCGIVSYEAYDECDGLRILIVRADIILADCEWNLNRCEVSCSLVDDGIGSRISNNKGIPISPLADRSKNGVAITPVPVLPLNIFDPAGVAPLFDARAMYDWLKCMQHAVQYMTDGAITLQSPWYNSLPPDERWAVTTGFQFRTADPTPAGIELIYKFEELFGEVAKKYNLWLLIRRDNSGNAVVYIEQDQDTFASPVAASFPWQDNLIQSVDSGQLWARVDVGSDNGTKNQGNIEALPFLTLLGFSKEEFQFETICNSDAVLDLVSKYTICTNTLERMIAGDDGEDDSTVLIQYSIVGSPFAGQATPGFWFNPGSPTTLYNEAILNKNVLERYALPSAVGIFAAPQAGNFLAFATNDQPATIYTNTAPVGSVVPFPGPSLNFNVDTPPGGFDPDGVWDVGTQRYAINAPGFYQFTIDLRSFVGTIGARVRPRIVATVFDVLNVSVQTFANAGAYRQDNAGNVVDVIDLSASITTIGYVTFDLFWDIDVLTASNTVGVQLRLNRRIFTQFVATGGGVTGNNLPTRIITYSFDRLTTARQWANMIDDPSKAIRVAIDDNLKTGHIMSATRNILKGTTSYEIICKRDQK
jgi:hypothetical protein